MPSSRTHPAEHTDPLRVLQINDYRSLGGAEVVLDRTCDLLREHGVEVECFTVESVPPHRLWPWRYIANDVACRALRTVLERFRPDAVHLHNLYHVLSPAILKTLDHWRASAMNARSGAKPRIVMTAHDHHLLSPNPLLRVRFNGHWRSAAAADRLSMWQLLNAQWDHRGRAFSAMRAAQWWWNFRLHKRRSAIDLVLCPSRCIMAEMQAAGLPVCFLPNPAPEPAAHVKKPAGTLQFVFAGRVEPEKGLAPFIASLPEDLAGQLTVVGDGSSLAECQQTVRNRGLNRKVTFLGRQSHEQTRSIIASSHVLVLPSLCLENAPNAMLEAIGCKTNLLVSNLGGMREIVDTSNIGYCFDPDDRRSLNDRLREIADAHERGTLNDFDAGSFLQQRGPDTYLQGLLAAYRGDISPDFQQQLQERHTCESC